MKDELTRSGGALIVLLTGAALAAGPARAADSRPDLSGSWVLNAEESDDAQTELMEAMQRAREQRGGRGGGFGGGGRGGRGGPGGGGPGGGGRAAEGAGGRMNGMLEGYEQLTIRHSDPELQIEYGDGLRIFRTDREKIDRVGELGTMEIRAEWKDERVVIERRSEGGRGGVRKLSEVLELKDGRLVLDQTIEGPAGKIEIHRVYDRAEPDPAEQ